MTALQDDHRGALRERIPSSEALQDPLRDPLHGVPDKDPLYGVLKRNRLYGVPQRDPLLEYRKGITFIRYEPF